MSGRKYGAGKAVALLATCAVVAAGAVTCTFIGVAATADASRALTITGACFGGIVFLLWLLRDRQPGNTVAERWAWLTRERPRKVEYRLSARRPTASPPPIPLSPPTAESVREITGGLHTWVPSQGSRQRQPPHKSDDE